MTTRRRSRRSSGRSVRRPTEWFNNTSVPATLAIGGVAVFDLLPLGGLPPALEGGLTVMRMLGAFNVRVDADGATIIVGMGVCVVTRDAFAAGAIPEPITDLVDWYFLKHTHQQGLTATARIVRDYEFDIRSKRRIRGVDRTLVAVIENSGISNATVLVGVSTRLLLARG